MDSIELEGRALSRITAAEAIVEAGIAVIGNIGLTPRPLVFLKYSVLKAKMWIVQSSVPSTAWDASTPHTMPRSLQNSVNSTPVWVMSSTRNTRKRRVLLFP